MSLNFIFPHPPVGGLKKKKTFFDSHSITGGRLHTAPHTEVCLKTALNSKLITPLGGYYSTTHNTHRYGHQLGGNVVAPSNRADRVCGPDPTGTCCSHAPSNNHAVFFRDKPVHGTGTGTTGTPSATPPPPTAVPQASTTGART